MPTAGSSKTAVGRHQTTTHWRNGSPMASAAALMIVSWLPTRGVNMGWHRGHWSSKHSRTASRQASTEQAAARSPCHDDAMSGFNSVVLDDGRAIDVRVSGPPDGLPFV